MQRKGIGGFAHFAPGKLIEFIYQLSIGYPFKKLNLGNTVLLTVIIETNTFEQQVKLHLHNLQYLIFGSK